MNSFSRLILWTLIGLPLLAQIASAQDHQIMYFRHNHAGAVTIGFDDGDLTQVQNAVPLMNARGLRGTFFVVTCDISCENQVTWDQWRQVAAQGHEIGSHTVTHPDLTTLSDADLQYELSQSQQTINQQIPTQTCLSLAYPGNDNNSTVQAAASQYYVSGRGGWADPEGGDMNFYQDLDPDFEPPPNLIISLGHRKAVNFYDVAGDNAPFADTLSNMEGKLDFAVANHAWYDMYLHDVPDQPFYINYLTTLLDDILARDLWAAPYGEVALYMRERMASTVSVLSSDSSMIQLHLTNPLNGAIYKEPLTIRSVVPSAWLDVSVTQGTTTTVVASTVESGSTVVYYDAAPNGGTITLTQAGPLISVSMSPSEVQGGTLSTGTVTLNAPAPAGGAEVSLTSSNTSIAQVPTSVTVLAGDTTANFTATTSSVSSDTPVTITAVYNNTSRTADLTVSVAAPVAALSGLSVSPATVLGGVSSTVTVTLTAVAPDGGAIVALTSSNTAAAQVPASVTVAAGATTASIITTTSSVTSDSPVTITGTYNSVSRTAILTVTAPPAVLTGVSVSPATVLGGNSSTGTVTLDSPAPTGGAVVSLASSDPATARVPTSVRVLAGATTTSFTATTSSVTSDTPVTITAVYNSVNQTTTLTVTAPVAALTGVSVSPTTVLGGATSTGTVTLNTAAPGAGAFVTLTSSNTAVAQVPVSVTVPAGVTTATFAATTSPLATKTAVTLTALYNSVSKSATLTVTPAALSKVSLSPTSVLGGASSTGTVTLSGQAPAGGVVVSLTSNNAAAQVPMSVTVPAGATTATFIATTSPVAANTAVTITALYAGVTKTAALTLTAPTVSTLTLNPASVQGGNQSQGTVTLNGSGPSSGVVVTLTSSNTAVAQVPSSITVAAGQTVATFAITTKAVTSNRSVTISAKCGTTVKAALTVTH